MVAAAYIAAGRLLPEMGQGQYKFQEFKLRYFHINDENPYKIDMIHDPIKLRQ